VIAFQVLARGERVKAGSSSGTAEERGVPLLEKEEEKKGKEKREISISRHRFRKERTSGRRVPKDAKPR